MNRETTKKRIVGYFDRFAIQMTKSEALSASHQGRCDDDVEYLVGTPKIRRQLDRIDPVFIRDELREYGAWDAEELADNRQNRLRIVWIAAGDIREEIHQHGRRQWNER